jgi:hypothetical protein
MLAADARRLGLGSARPQAEAAVPILIPDVRPVRGLRLVDLRVGVRRQHLRRRVVIPPARRPAAESAAPRPGTAGRTSRTPPTATAPPRRRRCLSPLESPPPPQHALRRVLLQLLQPLPQVRAPLHLRPELVRVGLLAIAAALLTEVWTDSVMGLQAPQVTRRVLDNLGMRPDDRGVVQTVAQNVDAMFGLHVLPAERVKRMILDWPGGHGKDGIIIP